MNRLLTAYYSIFPNKKKYLIYHSGTSNIILSAPHSGNIKPINIPNRKYGNRSRDTYTLELITSMINSLRNPYYIYSNIHRCKVDFNRDIKEACQDNIEMENLWNIWNRTLSDYLNTMRFFHKKALYVDIHSHNNSDKFQIGYGLPVKDYLILRDNKRIPTKNSTMHSLKEYSPTSYITEYSILFGDYSIPYTIERYGYKVLVPVSDASYLNGGRDITEFHGNGVGAIQIECPISVLKNDLNGVVTALVEAINIFSKKFL